jgi:hypothetical protein
VLNNPKPRTSNNKPIPLFFWSERKFIFKDNENYGDLLSKYLVEKIAGRPVKFVHPKKQPWYKLNKKNYLAVGSILHHATKESIVWGSGIIDRKQKVAQADFRAVRGPRTREYLLDLGYQCPAVYGDPALVLPRYFNPQVEKKYELGIIPHYHDYKEVSETYKNEAEILVIDLMTLDVEAVTRKILECKKTVSSSLHGLIVSHAYGIPSVWVEFSKKLFGDGVKFNDYLESVKLDVYEPQFLNEKKTVEELENLTERFVPLPDLKILEHLQQNLLKSSPFHEL